MNATLHRLLTGLSFASSPAAAAHPHVPVSGPRVKQRTLLDLVMPEYDFRSSATIRIVATPTEVFAALETVTLDDLLLVRLARTLRELPQRLHGRERAPESMTRAPLVRAARMLRLGDEPGCEVVLGLAGKLHNLRHPQLVDLPDLFTFTRFNDRACEKLAMSVVVTPDSSGTACLVTPEYRIQALGTSARRMLALDWYLLAGWGGKLLLRQLLRAMKNVAEHDPVPVPHPA